MSSTTTGGPRWDRRVPNYRAWGVVGSLGSSVWMLVIYGLPAVNFLNDWIATLEFAAPPIGDLVWHVVLGMGSAILGVTGLFLIWVIHRPHPVVAGFRALTAVATVSAGVVVARTDLAPSVPPELDYTLWATVMTFVALFAAVWGLGHFIIERGGLGT